MQFYESNNVFSPVVQGGIMLSIIVLYNQNNVLTVSVGCSLTGV